jgi:catechol 2,3-dioxygenase-like lactoylglutathione lyase family enzyme
MKTLLAFVVVLLVSVGAAFAQVDPPNRAGVAFSHLNLIVSDVAANKAFWISLGGTLLSGRDNVLSFPGLLVVLTHGQPAGGEAGSVVAHVAFRVKTFAQVEAKGLTVERRRIEGRESGMVRSPAGDPVELFEENAEQVRFRADPGLSDTGSNRHNEPMTAPIVPHHLHLNVPAGQDVRAQQWYVTLFGAVPGIRLRYPAADVPGMNFNFSAVETATAPTRGRALDHVGFEVRSLAEFARTLTAMGITFEQVPRDDVSGRPAVRFVDPWGTSIEAAEAGR